LSITTSPPLLRDHRAAARHSGVPPSKEHRYGHQTNQARQHFADVAAAVKELSGYTVDKMRATEEGKTNKAATREALASRLRTISRTARLIAADNPGMEDKFKYPKPQTDQALIAAGHLFAQDAEAFAGAFVAQVMPKTFSRGSERAGRSIRTGDSGTRCAQGGARGGAAEDCRGASVRHAGGAETRHDHVESHVR
jgi:hypothetical protein